MTLFDVSLKNSYESGNDSLVSEFYIPALSCAKKYDRIAGFFSSSSLALAARGLAELIKKDGKMRLITCPQIPAKDVQVIEQSLRDPESYLSKSMISELSVENDFEQDHIDALGWMLAKNLLVIKVAFVEGSEKGNSIDAVMHQKVGILYDEDCNSISFSGSINESASGWLNNIEEFKVFKAWDKGQKCYYESDRSKFERMWNGFYPGVKVFDLPEAVKRKLIENGASFSVEKITSRKYLERNYPESVNKSKSIELFYYQKEAIEQWKANNHKMILELATGCGKTITAISCISDLLKNEVKPVLVVIACPGNTLSKQWCNVIYSMNTGVDHELICDGTNQWKNEINIEIKKLSSGLIKNLVLYTTHQTASSKFFIDNVINASNKILKFLIGDEVHGMGASKAKEALLDVYDYRLGLSATPARWFDDYGTSIIENYFGNKQFVFSIHEAQTTINPKTSKPFLVNYYYHPRFISLTINELEEYKKLSDKISRMSSKNDEEKQKIVEFLCFQRANIEKRAENKYAELVHILNEIGNDIADTIIFVSDSQIDTVMRLLGERGILAHRFTQSVSTKPSKKLGGISEREYLIKQFKEKRYQVLVAIKCLDEGIDIPSAKRAIVMASSTNPREYIQRIGRVIRQADNKPNAEIYDMILKPDNDTIFEPQLKKIEGRIFQKELNRVEELSVNALNNTEILTMVYKMKGAFQL